MVVMVVVVVVVGVVVVQSLADLKPSTCRAVYLLPMD